MKNIDWRDVLDLIGAIVMLVGTFGLIAFFVYQYVIGPCSFWGVFPLKSVPLRCLAELASK